MDDRPSEPTISSDPATSAVASTTKPPAVKSPAHADRDSGAHIKETLESILIAFILAFIFRCFVVEAFVIPTGSMAPTLLGAHSRFQCPHCGYRFDVNYSNPRQGDDEIDIPDRVQSVTETDPATRKSRLVPVIYDDIHCPNCSLLLPPEPNPPVWYGDRILVLKYMYLLHDPQRWDVVVFKSPSEREKDYSINFIKRLIGTPGETIMVLDGDIYVKPKGGDHFEIARKSPAAQEALWRILYDNDFHPDTTLPTALAWQQPWQQTAGDGWKMDGANRRAFAFNSKDKTGTISFNASANRPDNKNFGFADWLAYDQRHTVPMFPRNHDDGWQGEYPVSDLKLDLYYTRTSGSGPLKLQLTKLDRTFTAEIRQDSVSLICEVDGEKLWEKTSPRPAAHGPVHIEFSNVDYLVTLKLDGSEVFATTAADYAPDVDDLKKRQMEFSRYALYPTQTVGANAKTDNPLPPPTVSITAEQQTAEVSHLSLWRDVYYTQKLVGGAQLQWGSPDPSPNGGPITLGPDEFFVMGDNSPMSYDARFWNKPIDLKDENLHVDSGRVPERFLLGKAFFVYWPAGFRPAKTAPGIIPNFGQMRFIR